MNQHAQVQLTVFCSLNIWSHQNWCSGLQRSEERHLINSNQSPIHEIARRQSP